MRLTSLLSVLAVVVHHAHSSYVALAPTEFHPGWDYTVQLMVSNATSDVVITGTIYNSQKTILGAGFVTLSNGGSGQLDIKVPASVSPDSFTLELVGTGGLSFSNSTTITLDPLTHLTFIQTDKKIYKANQLIRVRVLTVDKDLVPQKVAKTITIQNPMQSTLAKFQDDGTKSVFEDTYQLTEFPDLGDWKIVVESKENNINEELTFKVDEYVLPKFEVSAEVVPSFLIKDKNQGPVEVTVAVTATYTYGKGVMGEIKLTVMGPNDVKQEIRDTIVDPSGKKNMAVDLTQALNQINSNSGIQIKVEVTDETQRTYDTMVTVRVEDQPVKVEFDKVRTDLVYRTGMPIQVVVKVTDPVGMPLDTMYMENPLTLSLTDREDSSKSMEQTFSLTAGQTEVVWNIPSMTSTNSYLDLRASMTVGGRELLRTENIRKYETVGNAMLNARWTAYTPMLSMGSSASFVVDVSDSSHFSSLAYMIVSRGNIQAFGSVVAGQTTNVAVTTDMCPKGKLVVYGVTTVSPVSSSPEIIADSLDLKLEHCQDKKVTPSVGSDTQKTGTSALINVDVTWTDSSKQQSIGQHDVYMLAVDKSITLLEGDNDINPARVETELEKFNLESASGKGGRGPWWRRKRSIIGPDFPGYSDTPTSTGELLQAVGLVVLADVSLKQEERWPVYFYDMPEFAVAGGEDGVDVDGAAEMGPVDDGVQNMVPTSAGGAGAGTPPATVTVRKDFPDTWIFKSIQTNNNGQAMTNETLPDTITSWVISAFAVRNDSEIAVTADPFELNAYNPFFVSLNLPYSIRRTERFELRATVFNYESSDLATTVILASSDKYEIAGDSSKTMMVKSNTANSVTFMIVATKVDLISIKVTARAQNANGARFVDAIDKKLIVKPEGVERMRAITFPVMLSDAEPVFDQNVALDFSPWTLADVVPDSRRARVKITGDMMGNALEDIDRLVSMPTGCGEQNMITTIPNIYAMAYLTAIDDVKPDFALKALEYMKTGYTKETQQYRWDNGGYSAFGKSDQAASTWLTAFVLKSFAQAKQYIPNTVDTDILDSAVSFLFTRQTQDSGLFYELGRVIHDDMQGGTGAGDALSVYIVICMLEAKKYGVEIDDNKMSLAFSYVLDLAERDMVKDKKFLSAITAYALALYNPTDAGTVLKIESLIGYIVEKGAPWRQKKESDTVKPTEPYGYHHPSGPSDVEIGAYCLLALHTVGKVDEGREILLWLQKQQNSNGGFSSTQDTVMALQAIAAYSTIFANRVPSGNIVVTPLDPSASAMSVDITADNSAVLQIIELPDETNMLNIRVTGNADSIAVVKVVWYFYTAPNTEEQPPSGPPVINISNPLKVTTRTTMVRPGFHNVEACMKPDGLDYNNMMVLTMNMPSGFVSEDLQEARNQNPSVVRMEQEDDMVHCYFNQPEDGCVNLVIEETVKVENLKPGSARVYAYYKPDDFQAEASIQLEVPCVGENCGTSRAACPAALSRLLLAACVCLLLSLVVAL